MVLPAPMVTWPLMVMRPVGPTAKVTAPVLLLVTVRPYRSRYPAVNFSLARSIMLLPYLSKKSSACTVPPKVPLAPASVPAKVPRLA